MIQPAEIKTGARVRTLNDVTYFDGRVCPADTLGAITGDHIGWIAVRCDSIESDLSFYPRELDIVDGVSREEIRDMVVTRGEAMSNEENIAEMIDCDGQDTFTVVEEFGKEPRVLPNADGKQEYIIIRATTSENFLISKEGYRKLLAHSQEQVQTLTASKVALELKVAALTGAFDEICSVASITYEDGCVLRFDATLAEEREVTPWCPLSAEIFRSRQ